MLGADQMLSYPYYMKFGAPTMVLLLEMNIRSNQGGN
jgi:hypothetical protein